MRLMTKELEKRFAQVGSQRDVKDPVIIAKFFTSDGALWYATEYNPGSKRFSVTCLCSTMRTPNGATFP